MENPKSKDECRSMASIKTAQFFISPPPTGHQEFPETFDEVDIEDTAPLPSFPGKAHNCGAILGYCTKEKHEHHPGGNNNDPRRLNPSSKPKHTENKEYGFERFRPPSQKENKAEIINL